MHRDSRPPVGLFLSIGNGALEATPAQRASGDGNWNGDFPRTFMSPNTRYLEGMFDLTEKQISDASQDLSYYRFCIDFEGYNSTYDIWSKDSADMCVGAGARYLKEREEDELKKRKEQDFVINKLEDLSKCALQLVERRRATAQTEKWGSFAQATQYKYPIDRCEYGKGGGKGVEEDKIVLNDLLRLILRQDLFLAPSIHFLLPASTSCS